MDTGRMLPAIESDRAGRPWVELWSDWLHRVDVPERVRLRSLFGIWVVYIMFTILTWGRGDFFCPLCLVAGDPRRRSCFATPSLCLRHLTCRPV